ncbi:MAG: 30S ribosomal protein S8 [Polyangia bacterium]|jgi:small subunit ribosomal protein S8
MTDPIADFLARIRNAIMARRTEVTCPSSSLKVRIADVMKDEGYIVGYDVRPGWGGHSEMVLRLRWPDPHANAITGLRRRSRPGQRVYVGRDRIAKVRSGLGIAILSTSRGLMTDRAARKAGIGGELLCEVW